ILSTTSRLMRWKSRTNPLWTNRVPPCRNGWQFDCCTGDPIAARTWAMNAPDSSVSAISRRFSSFHAGSVDRYRVGLPVSGENHPNPKPSPLTGSAPWLASRLWCTIVLARWRNMTEPTLIGFPRYAIHRHTINPPLERVGAPRGRGSWGPPPPGSALRKPTRIDGRYRQADFTRPHVRIARAGRKGPSNAAARLDGAR